ncbi:Centrosomal protein of 78 kDa [Collichthys lucidus]|uniref:Centrosomal protein of 78 kDa n=1 Tax=Collichthys lucidus TaxID=240159 RepID=A0A4V6APW6_COLLU|nr:Centrosomal protein of 78 kDa [Collichthys lucidus]
MVQDSAHIRQRGAQDFMAYYDFACARQESVPLPAVKMNLDKGMLDFNGDRVKLTDWPPILNSICINKHLHHIAISSTYQARLGSGDADRRYYKSSLRKKIPAIRSKDMTFKLCKALRECLTVSPKLKTLQLNGLPLRERDLITLTKGMQRHGTAWAESLRYRHPQFEGMGGLRRVTLNCNTLIGDRGAAALAHELVEDLWVKAVDLQRCGLSSDGARHLLEALKTNSTLCVLDIRSNPLVDKVLIKTVIEKVLMNSDGQSPEPLVKGHLEGRAQVLLRHRSPIHVPVMCLGVLLHELDAREYSVSVVAKTNVMLDAFVAEGAATVKITVESDTDEEEGEEEEEVVVEVEQRPSSLRLQERITGRQFEHLQMELKECRLRLAEERRARLKAESRLIEYELENARLRNTNLSLSEALAATGSASAPPAISALEDEAVLESIESSFTKFHSFLDLLKDAGLGQLASMAGVDKSDFQPLGRPQLSSTIGPHLDGAASQTREEYQDVWAKTDALSVGGSILPAPPGRLANTTTPPSSVREFLREDRMLDVTFNQDPGPAVAPCLGGDGEPDKYSMPVTQHDSGSEHSFCSQKSFDKVYFGKTFQTQPSHSNSNSNSHRSNGSYGYSFNNSPAHSHASHSNGSHGESSGRSSVSEQGRVKEQEKRGRK